MEMIIIMCTMYYRSYFEKKTCEEKRRYMRKRIIKQERNVLLQLKFKAAIDK